MVRFDDQEQRDLAARFAEEQAAGATEPGSGCVYSVQPFPSQQLVVMEFSVPAEVVILNFDEAHEMAKLLLGALKQLNAALKD